MVKLVDASDSKSDGEIRAGSSPARGTTHKSINVHLVSLPSVRVGKSGHAMSCDTLQWQTVVGIVLVSGMYDTNMLTDLAIRKLKPGPKPIKKADGGGLYLFIPTTGSKLWRLAYRFDRKQLTMALGAYPAVSLAEARAKRDSVKVLLAQGLDPRVSKDVPVEAGPGQSLREVGEAWFAAQLPQWKPSYSERIKARLERDIFAELGEMPLSGITKPILLKALRKVEERGATHIAKRLKNHVGEILRYAAAEGAPIEDITVGMERALQRNAPVRHRAKLSADDLPEFMRDLATVRAEPITIQAIQLMMLTFVRTNELRFAKWSEFDFKAKLWRIPGARMKMGLEHLVPLADQTLELLKEIPRGKDYLFPYHGPTGVISENRMIYTLYRMGYHTRATIHGFRGTASTILNEEGWNKDWVERQLAHVEADAVRGAYNAAEYLSGRKKMMAWWADYLTKAQLAVES